MTQQNDPRLAPIERLKELLPLCPSDDKRERQLIHRLTLKERVQR